MLARANEFGKSHKRKAGTARSRQGQALIEYSCCLALFLPILVAFVNLSISVSMAFLYQVRLQNVANAAASYYSGGHYWLGSVRADNSGNETLLKERMAEIVDKMLSATGLPKSAQVDANFNMENGSSSVGVSVVTITVPGIKLPFPGLNIGQISATGVSAEGSQPPYACLRMFIPVNDGQADRVCAVLPALGFGVQPNGVNTSASGFASVPGHPGETVQQAGAKIWVHDFEAAGHLSRPGNGTELSRPASPEAMDTSTGNLYFGR